MSFEGIAGQLSSNPIVATGLVFLAGVLTSLTPCIYPMIPITAAIVGGQSATGEPTPRSRTILLTLMYVAGLATVYASLGVIAGMTGTIFGTISTNPWLYFAMANLLLIAALSLLDVLPVRLPASLVQRASTAGTAGRVSGSVDHGRSVWTCSRTMLGTCNGRCSYMGYYDSARRSRIYLSLELFARHVCIACRGGNRKRNTFAVAEVGPLDGVDQARVCARDDRRQ
jgi:Thiol:disulfide interchange protein